MRSYVPSPSVDYWLACSPLGPRFAGSIPTEVDGFFKGDKNPEHHVDLRHVKEPYGHE
jgi:hypothetical protein